MKHFLISIRARNIIVITLTLLVAVSASFVLFIVIDGKIQKDKDDSINNNRPYEEEKEYDQADSKSTTLKEVTSPEELDACLNSMEKSIIGTWEYFGGEMEYPTRFVFQKDNYFTFEYVGEGSDKLTGIWHFDKDKATIGLKFTKLDSFWEQMLQDDLTKYGWDNIESYSYEDKQITFYIGYFPNPNAGFNGICEEDRFYINLFGFLIYKVS